MTSLLVNQEEEKRKKKKKATKPTFVFISENIQHTVTTVCGFMSDSITNIYFGIREWIEF